MTIKSVDNMTAVKNIDEKDILGHLMWYSVGKQLIDAKELQDKLIQSGLEESWMPNKIRSVDAFRRATKEVETRKLTDKANVYENYIIREVFAEHDTVQRNIVVETVDQNGKRLDYNSEAAVITLDKVNDHITFTTTSEQTVEMCKEIENRYTIYKNYYSAQQVRVMVNKILQSLAPVPVRPNGGIYFIPNSHTGQLKRLVAFTGSLENSEGFKIPVVDTFDNKQMVTHKLNDHLDDIIRQCQSSENLRKSQVKDIINDAKAAVEDYKNYKGIVSEQSDVLENKIDLIRLEVRRLITEMD